MLFDHPLPCSCGQTPDLNKNQIPHTNTFTYRFECVCGKFTFAAGQEECARELWNAAIQREKKVNYNEK